MFENCFSLKSLNISKFHTSFVTNMEKMFYNCSKLTSLNLSHFKGNKTKNLNSMFAHCSSLIILNLSNFNTPELTDMDYMLNGCSKLKYANLSLFNDTLLIKSTIRNLKELNIFNGIPDNFIICLNEESRYLYELIESNANWTINCSKDICTHYHYYDNSGEIFSLIVIIALKITKI